MSAASSTKPRVTGFSDGPAGFALLTYLGGIGIDSATSVAVDVLGNLYVAGTTSSTDLRVSASAFQPANQGGDSDGFVIKLSPTGSLVYSTYLGGKGGDAIYGLAVDRMGNAYVTGSSDSKNFPTTDGALAGKDFYFTAKLNATGTDLVYSSRGIGGAAIALDASGNAYVAGATNERDFPTTLGAFQTTYGGGQEDAFVAKLNAKGDALVYATYFGGGRDEYISAIAVDADGNAYVGGNFLYSPFVEQRAFPTTPGAFLESPPTHPASFITKFNATGSALLYSTYVEASLISGIAIDDEGNAYVTGDATFVAATPSAFQKSSGGVCCYTFSQFYNGGGDAFVMKLNRSGSALMYATYLGGSNYDAGRSIAVDSAGNAYIAGFTDSADFPLANQSQIGGRGVIRSDDGGGGWAGVSGGLRVGDVKVLVIDPKDSSTLYAGSQIGLFKSTNSGNSWNPINNGLMKSNSNLPYPAFGVHSLVIDPVSSSTIYTVLDAGLFKSLDAGGHWSLIRAGYVGGLAVDPVNPSTIYAASATVIKSTDGGITWGNMNLGFGEAINWVNKVVIAPTSPPTVFADLFLQATTPDTVGVIKSTDSGVTWQRVGRGPSGRGLAGSVPWSSVPLVVDPQTPNTVYLGSLKSTDSGVTWSALNFTSVFINALAVDPAMPTTLYAGAGEYADAGVYKSTDGGSSWTLTHLNGVSIYSLSIDPKNPSIVYAGTGINSDAFVTKLDSKGSIVLLSSLAGGFSRDSANAVAVDPHGNVYIAGATSSSGLSTTSAFQGNYAGSGDAFVGVIGSRDALQPKIFGASISRKALIVLGQDFDFGATVLIDGKSQKNSENDPSNPTTTLIARKSVKNISSGQTVKLQVRNPDGTLSSEFAFTRP